MAITSKTRYFAKKAVVKTYQSHAYSSILAFIFYLDDYSAGYTR